MTFPPPPGPPPPHGAPSPRPGGAQPHGGRAQQFGAPQPPQFGGPQPRHPFGMAPVPHPPGYGAQGYGAAPDAVPVPPGAAIVEIQTGYTPMAFLLGLTGPDVLVDGRIVGTRWGQCPVPVAPGRHQVSIHTRYLGQMGKAHLVLDAAPGQRVPVFYRPPALVGMRGAIGHVPQSTPGMGAIVALNVVAVALIFLLLLVPLLAG